MAPSVVPLLKTPAGPLIPMPPSEDTCRIANENGLSILLPPNWECQRKGGLLFNSIVLVPETPFLTRCLAMKYFRELPEASKRSALSKTDLQVRSAWEVLDTQPPTDIDAPTTTHYYFVFQSNGTGMNSTTETARRKCFLRKCGTGLPVWLLR